MTDQTSRWRPISEAISEASAIRPLPVRTPGAHRPDPHLVAADRDFFTARTAASPRYNRDLSQGLPYSTDGPFEPECA
ncbi:hypothetical protein AB0O82_13700 [Kitasatospora sp. NPDC088264]|uniref:hypothetical protein n=1 Tax=Kitasatospora sp. NPDC088264 TaxID=3155296 RepID=UPI0034472343